MNEPTVVFRRCFYIKRCDFLRTIFWCHQSYGSPPFLCKKFKIHEKITSFFAKNLLVNPLFPRKTAFSGFPVWKSIEKMMLFLFILESECYAKYRFNECILSCTKKTKNDNFSEGAFVMQLVTPRRRIRSS